MQYTDIAIRVEDLAKLYHIGAAQKRHDTLRDVIGDWKFDPSLCASKLPISNSTIWALKAVSSPSAIIGEREQEFRVEFLR
jgi:hypothetical protein